MCLYQSSHCEDLRSHQEKSTSSTLYGNGEVLPGCVLSQSAAVKRCLTQTTRPREQLVWETDEVMQADPSRSFLQAVQRCSDKDFAGLSCAPCVITRSSSSCQIPSEPLGARQQPAPSTEFHATKAGLVLILYIQFTRPRPRPNLNP